jgi:hypothetical protein
MARTPLSATVRVLVGLAVLMASTGCADAEPKGNFASQYDGAKPSTQLTVDFEKAEPGKTPPEFVTALTGGGGAASWVVQAVEKAPSGRKVLAQTSSDATDHRFPLCVLKDFAARDVEVTTSFRAVAGKVDQAAGLVARYRDKDNYYVVRANALEDNVRLYYVAKGDRRQFAGATVKISAGDWHTLKLSVKGNHFQVSVDGRPLFEADDETFKDAGGVGLWTKADSVTQFDDLSVAPFDPK